MSDGFEAIEKEMFHDSGRLVFFEGSLHPEAIQPIDSETERAPPASFTRKQLAFFRFFSKGNDFGRRTRARRRTGTVDLTEVGAQEMGAGHAGGEQREREEHRDRRTDPSQGARASRPSDTDTVQQGPQCMARVTHSLAFLVEMVHVSVSVVCACCVRSGYASAGAVTAQVPNASMLSSPLFTGKIAAPSAEAPGAPVAESPYREASY